MMSDYEEDDEASSDAEEPIGENSPGTSDKEVGPPDESSDESDDADDDDDEEAPLVQASNTRPLYVLSRRVTRSTMTLYEFARALGIRAEQIAKTGKAFIDDVGAYTDCRKIARAEMLQRRSPLVLERTLRVMNDGTRKVERWLVREMGFPSDANSGE
jgi:DNA-directed RNA polymerase subunit K/omega